MRETVLVLPLVFIVPFLVAQTLRKHPRAGAASAHLASPAISALQKIDPEHIRANVRFLSHDLLEGRGTGQRGGDIAAEYIATQFSLDGLKPGGEDGSYMQKVPLVGITPAPETSFGFVPRRGDPMQLRPL